MCTLCTQWELGKMTNKEAIGAAAELIEFETNEEERHHLFGLINRVMDKEDEIIDSEELVYLNDLEEEDDYECP